MFSPLGNLSWIKETFAFFLLVQMWMNVRMTNTTVIPMLNAKTTMADLLVNAIPDSPVMVRQDVLVGLMKLWNLIFEKWTKKNWLERDSNWQPPEYRTGALPTELSSPMLVVSLIVNYLCSFGSQKPWNHSHTAISQGSFEDTRSINNTVERRYNGHSGIYTNCL